MPKHVSPKQPVTKQPSSKTRVQSIMAALLAISLIAGWRPLLATFELAWRDERYTHILLILPIMATLVYLDRSFLRLDWKPKLIWGCFAIYVLLIAIVLRTQFLETSDVWLSTAMFALSFSWIVVFIMSFGIPAARRCSFPLFLLLGLTPLPVVVLDQLVRWLQQASANSALALFTAAGVPAMQNGILIAVPGLTIEVAKECSSIRSSSMLLLTSMVLAQLILRSPWRKALIIAVAVPLSVAKNGLRIFTIVMLGTRVNRVFLTGSFHHQGGVVFFAIALLAVGLLIAALKRGDVRGTEFMPAPEPSAIAT